MSEKQVLTRNETLVYALLEQSETPLSAYDILDALRGDGIRAPLQVYRALNKLIDKGAVHRIESKNAFVACSVHGCPGHATTIFMLCTACDAAEEFSESQLVSALTDICDSRGFEPARTVVEITGLCSKCQTLHH